MSTFWTDMLFLHGYIRDLELARRWANKRMSPRQLDKSPGKDGPRRIFSFGSARLCLGIGDGDVRAQ